MNLKRWLILLAFVPLISNAQPFYKNGSFVIKGQVKNPRDSFFEFGLTTYLDSDPQSVKIQSNGSFKQRFPVQYRQNVYLNLNDDALAFTVQDKDTITLYWDESDFKNTFTIKGINEARTKDLTLQLALYYGFRKPVVDLKDSLYKDKNLPDDKKYALINELFNRNVQAALHSGDPASENFNHLLTKIYFQYADILRSNRLTPRYSLKLASDATHPNPYPPFIAYTTLNEKWFWNVPEYRDFIFEYGRFTRQFYAYVPFENYPDKPFNPTLDEYHLAEANINSTNIREWFITESIMYGFGHYNFTDVEKVYKQAVNSITSPYLKDTLQKYYTGVKQVRPGNPAPGFILKNDQGKLVSLNRFKGKVVYVDFWSVDCAPCIYEIKNNVPQLHEHYKSKDVVFINICIDTIETEWKAALEKYKLDGINLITEGWNYNPLCKTYNVNSIPHHVLIDKFGKIINNNGPKVTELDLSSGKNDIDRLLK